MEEKLLLIKRLINIVKELEKDDNFFIWLKESDEYINLDCDLESIESIYQQYIEQN